MPKSESPRIEALEALLAERRKHESYLAKLEERRASTPEHVYKRLRDEYATKLTDLQVRAAMEADSLASGIEADEVAVAEIESKLAAVMEERIEGELRAEVGEYDAKEWSKKSAVLNATISQLEKERDARAGAFERTRALVTEATAGAASAAAPAPDAAGTSSPPGVLPDGARGAAPGAEPTTGASDRPGSGPSKAPGGMASGPSFDELAFLNSVVGRVSMPVPPSPAPAPRPATPVRPVTPARPTPEAAPAPTPVPTPSPVPAVSGPPASPAAPPPPRSSGAFVGEPASAPSPDPAAAPTKEPQTAPRQSAAVPRPPQPSFSAPPPSEDEPPGPLGRPTPRTSQAIKTLKCQECGTLNYPTEWYCERCGGELAAL